MQQGGEKISPTEICKLYFSIFDDKNPIRNCSAIRETAKKQIFFQAIMKLENYSSYTLIMILFALLKKIGRQHRMTIWEQNGEMQTNISNLMEGWGQWRNIYIINWVGVYRDRMSERVGLVFCGGKMGDPYCVAKLIQTILSGLLVIFIIADGISQIKLRGRFVYGFSQVLQTLMLLTLICNITYSMDHVYDWFYYLESLFYDWYFCTLVFYVTYQVLSKSQRPSPRRLKLLKIFFVLIMSVFLAIFIYSGITKIQDCKEIWFLLIDLFGLALCIAMVSIGYENHKQQIRKVLDYKNDNRINNPLSRMWILILINVFCQLIQFSQSLAFFIQSSNRCHFSSVHVVDVVVKLIFSLFSMHLSFACTIFILFRRRRKQQKYLQTIERSHTFDNRHRNMVELVPSSPLWSMNSPQENGENGRETLQPSQI